MRWQSQSGCSRAGVFSSCGNEQSNRRQPVSQASGHGTRTQSQAIHRPIPCDAVSVVAGEWSQPLVDMLTGARQAVAPWRTKYVVKFAKGYHTKSWTPSRNGPRSLSTKRAALAPVPSSLHTMGSCWLGGRPSRSRYPWRRFGWRHEVR